MSDRPPVAVGSGTVGRMDALRRMAAPKPPPEPTRERCEFCGEDIGERHGHIADLTDHRLMCVCRPCYLLFSPRGAGGGRYRGVGEEVRRVADLDLDDSRFDALRIPVDLVFFFRQTGDERLLAFYPGPGGAVESELELDAWTGIAGANPALDQIEPDVEAVLLRRTSGAYEAYLVPVDVCYELVGIVRSRWTGLGGGPEVWREIDAFFEGLSGRAAETAATGTDDG